MAESEVLQVPQPARVPAPLPVLDVEEVRAKLLAIIDANPEKNGAAPRLKRNDDEGEGACYYFLDAQDCPISDSVSREEVAAPCCIVGHFFFDHPGAMDADSLLNGMMRNESISWVLRAEERDFNYPSGFRPVAPPIPITPAATSLLSAAQSHQDEKAGQGGTWADIRADIANWPQDETV